MVTVTTRGVLRKSDLRETNERLILNLIRQNVDVSRSDIVRMTGLSPSSVTFIVNRLIDEGLIAVERRNGQAQAGRPPISLLLRSDAMYVVAAEISLSQTRIATADIHGRILSERRVSWHANPDIFLGRVRSGIKSVIEKFSDRRLLGIGIGIPGTLHRGDGTVAAENLGWFDVEAGRILSEGMPVKVLVENDAKLSAFAERWFCPPGAAAPRDFIFVATRGGVGTGIFVNGRLLRGASGEASEFGHTILYPDGRACVCGGRGCWEEYASDRALERTYAERARPAQHVPAEEIVRRARQGESIALEALQEIAVHVGLGFANLRQAFDPEVIIVGNYLGEAWDLIGNSVWDVLRARIVSRYLDRMRIVPAQHTEDSALMGAMAIVLSHFFGGADHSRPATRSKRTATATVS
jgi:predicted NBD/HSP70 family sugar kinase